MIIETPTNSITITAAQMQAEKEKTINDQWQQLIESLDNETIDELALILK